jgi:hypothetical protein
MINPKEYFGALGSTSLYKAYVMKFIRDNNLMPEKFPNGQYSTSGCNNYDFQYKNVDVRLKIKDELSKMEKTPVKIDSVGFQELIQLKDALQQKGVKVFGYFHPLPYEIFSADKENLQNYQNKVSSSLNIKIIDFNTAEYEYFSKDYSNYIDHGHLTRKGQNLLFNEVVSKLDSLGLR